MRDVPLQDAVIAVNRAKIGRAAEVKVLRRYDAALVRYEFTAGAGEDRWDRYPSHRLGFLYETMWFLAHTFGIASEVIHAAAQAIPEYRDLDGNDMAA